ncbi:hypothetical protein [Georgenia daeguensis]|uniref:DUF2637 domain-containing protein n=1 Tax=Georgenia daeguensis TaxID=908355 RepID=A0ABP8ETN9_9MICO
MILPAGPRTVVVLAALVAALGLLAYPAHVYIAYGAYDRLLDGPLGWLLPTATVIGMTTLLVEATVSRDRSWRAAWRRNVALVVTSVLPGVVWGCTVDVPEPVPFWFPIVFLCGFCLILPMSTPVAAELYFDPRLRQRMRQAMHWPARHLEDEAGWRWLAEACARHGRPLTAETLVALFDMEEGAARRRVRRIHSPSSADEAARHG